MLKNELMLEAKNITKKFPGVLALSDVKLDLYKGEVLALIGENGAGKSTLMKILLGEYQPTEGDMYFQGKAYKPKSPHDALNIGISMIHQELSLVPHMSVAENIWIGRESQFSRLGIISSKLRNTATKELLKRLDIDVNPEAIVSSLSVANMQLVEVARAVSYNSDVIIMDEPTSALTNVETVKLYKIIRDLAAQNKSVIFISHKLEELFTICDRITVFRDGKYIDTKPTNEVTKDELVKMMVGRDVSNLFPKEDVAFGDIAFEVEALTHKGFFEDISFSVRRGEILGFCGLMGAGRTEIMQSIFGIDKLTSGKIMIDGKEVKIKSVREAIDNKLAMVTEDRARRGAIHRLSVKVNMTLAYLDSICKFGFVNTKKENQDCDKMVQSMSIKISDHDQAIGSLSGGNQQKVIIGKWLLSGPEILILDEPTRGIDVGAKSEIYKLIGNLAKQGKAVIMVSSELPELMGISDRILVIRNGKISGEFQRDEFSQEELMAKAFGI